MEKIGETAAEKGGGRPYADLHIHSCFSDGTEMPEEVLKQAAGKGIGLLAITDHDVVEGSERLAALQTAVKCLSGVELTAVEEGNAYHILGYGFSFQHKGFRDFVRKNRECLELVSVQLIEKMQRDCDCVSLEDYNAYSYDVKKGGWKALHYLMARGLSSSMRESLGYYGKYAQSYGTVGFPTVSAVCAAVHEAGGKTVLAHPGKVIPFDWAFEEKLQALLPMGLDGLECYYPYDSRREEIISACLDFCTKHELLITCGSDSHGAFEVENTPMGIMEIKAERLRLGGLVH